MRVFVVDEQDSGGFSFDKAFVISVGDANPEVITGDAGNNKSVGGVSSDTFNGGGGSDILTGGLGNDTHITDGGDTITEALNGGSATVQSSVTYTLGANLENLTLVGASPINGTGNGLANIIIGNGAANCLKAFDDGQCFARRLTVREQMTMS